LWMMHKDKKNAGIIQIPVVTQDSPPLTSHLESTRSGVTLVRFAVWAGNRVVHFGTRHSFRNLFEDSRDFLRFLLFRY